tara:strand:- start:561 stop:1058 length:498 start_codon:yes stop_codon:yes gene_type:complete
MGLPKGYKPPKGLRQPKKPKIVGRPNRRRYGNNRVKPMVRGLQKQFDCLNLDYDQCFRYLSKQISKYDRNSNYLNDFTEFYSNLGVENYGLIQSGEISGEEYMQQYNQQSSRETTSHHTYNPVDFFCGGSNCGNYYGFGCCHGGCLCCGVGGLGVGCNYKFKNEK